LCEWLFFNFACWSAVCCCSDCIFYLMSDSVDVWLVGRWFVSVFVLFLNGCKILSSQGSVISFLAASGPLITNPGTGHYEFRDGHYEFRDGHYEFRDGHYKFRDGHYKFGDARNGRGRVPPKLCRQKQLGKRKRCITRPNFAPKLGRPQNLSKTDTARCN
jgi:hypothetical protein